MRASFTGAIVLITSLIPSRCLIAADTHAELVAEVQAADLLSDLLTCTADRASCRVNVMSNYLKEIGKADDFTRGKPSIPPRQKSLFYSDLFSGAVQFIKTDGAKYADPGLARLNDQQLFAELSALQTFNIQQ